MQKAAFDSLIGVRTTEKDTGKSQNHARTSHNHARTNEIDARFFETRTPFRDVSAAFSL